jgi:spermidine synthase
MVDSGETAAQTMATRMLLPLFFVSGATALVYQTLWARELHLVFGTSSFAIATVLAAFMAGLAIGGAWMAKKADTVDRPLRRYGLLEIVIGCYGLLFPAIVELVSPVYLWVWSAVQPPPLMFGVIQFLLVGSALLLPTTMMGATLPLLARFATKRLGGVGDSVGVLYGVNTAGAVIGTALCGFYLLPEYGLWQTTVYTGIANIVLGCLAIGLDYWARSRDTDRVTVVDDLDPETLHHPDLKGVAWGIGLAGAASLIYEIAWTRLLVLLLGASVYAFSVMLLAFLIGIAFGGVVGGGIADRTLKRFGAAGVYRALVRVEIGIALLSFAMMYIFGDLPYWYVWLFDAFGVQDGTGSVWVVSILIAGLVMTPPAILMGIAFPLAVRAVVTKREALGGPVGAVYAANTAGSLLGASIGGFLLLPVIGIKYTIVVAGLVNITAAAVFARRISRSSSMITGVKRLLWSSSILLVGLGLFAPWNPLLMTAGMYKYVSQFKDHTRAGITDYAIDQYDLIFYEEGLSTVVTVAKNRETGSMWLANNGKVDASSNIDMPTQVLVALLPFQFVEETNDVLVIGLASGITAGAVSMVDDIKRLDVVELEPATRRAAALFSEFNHDVLNDPRLNLVMNDGRNHILLAEEKSYNVIVSEPSNPWISGVSNLFTREFFEVGKSRLKEGGVWAQWVQMYGMGTEDLRSILKTFSDVYPYVAVYTTIIESDLVLVGSREPLLLQFEAENPLLTRWPNVTKELAEVGIVDEMSLLATYLMDRDAIVEMVGDVAINTDDNMRVEYSAPMNLHQPTSEANVALLLEHARFPPGSVLNATSMAELAQAYIAREDYQRGKPGMVEALLRLAQETENTGLLPIAEIVAEYASEDRWPEALRAMDQVVSGARDQTVLPADFVVAYDAWRDGVVE